MVSDVLRALDDEERPAAILVADDERYVAEALLFPATDYVTSPISADRLALALKRACSTTRRVGRGLAAQTPTDNKTEARSARFLRLAHRERLVGERAGRLYFFSPIDVDYIEADSNYVKIHVGSQCYINRDSLTRLSALLEDSGFVRISRAILLNLGKACASRNAKVVAYWRSCSNRALGWCLARAFVWNLALICGSHVREGLGASTSKPDLVASHAGRRYCCLPTRPEVGPVRPPSSSSRRSPATLVRSIEAKPKSKLRRYRAFTHFSARCFATSRHALSIRCGSLNEILFLDGRNWVAQGQRHVMILPEALAVSAFDFDIRAP